jgi:DNA-binding SARP family transcriptional activator/tetratricopeptide (TPR) repeat protein
MLWIQLLGPVQVRRGDQVLELGGLQQRWLLAALALDPGRPRSYEVLQRAVWPETPPGNPIGALHKLANGLRKLLKPPVGVLETHVGTGYELRVAREQVDVFVFRQHCRSARQARADGDLANAVDLLDAALSLWHGKPLDGLDGSWAEGIRAGLVEEWRAATGDRIEVNLELGGHAEVISELARLVCGRPLDERFHRLHMLALYRCGRADDAVAAYQHARSLWRAGPLATEPPAGLQKLYQQILNKDPALTPSPRLTGPARSAPPWELPADVRAFTGREEELAALDRLLPGPGRSAGTDNNLAGRAVVISALSGTAGVGKTALAVYWAHRAKADFPDGVLYVNLRGYDSSLPVPPEQALGRFLQAMGVKAEDIPQGSDARAARYRTVMRDRRMLVVLDNTASEEQVRPLLPGTGTAVVLVTSRDSLTGLCAREGAHRLDLGLLPTADAAGLLCTLIGDRATSDPGATAELARLCARLPLALRIAAELANSRPHIPLAALAAELEDQETRLDLLDAGGDPGTAVRAVFSWSCEHLPPGAAAGFAVLGLHPAPDWDCYAAAALTGTTPAEADKLLGVLGRAHLIQPIGPGRYGMHDLLRAYATELAVHGRDGPRQALTRLFDYYLAAATTATDTLVCWLATADDWSIGFSPSMARTAVGSGPGPAYRDRRPGPPPPGVHLPALTDPSDRQPRAADAWLQTELPSLIVIAAYTASHGWPEHTVRLATALDPYLSTTEPRLIYTYAADAADACGDYPAQAHFLISLGTYDYQQGHRQHDPGRYQQAIGRYQQALDIARSCGNASAHARALVNLGLAYGDQGHYRLAAECYQQALTLARTSGDTYGQACALNNLGSLHSWQRHYTQAAPFYRMAQRLCRAIRFGDGEFIATNNLRQNCSLIDHCARSLRNGQDHPYDLINLGHAYRQAGHHQQAIERFEQARDVACDAGDSYHLARALNNLGAVHAEQGRYPEATACYQAVLELHPAASDFRALNGLGCVCAWQGLPEQAASYFRQAASQPSPSMRISQDNLDQLTYLNDGHYCQIPDFPDPPHEPEQYAFSDGHYFPLITFWEDGRTSLGGGGFVEGHGVIRLRPARCPRPAHETLDDDEESGDET